MEKMNLVELPVLGIDGDFPFGGSVVINTDRLESINISKRESDDHEPAVSIVMASGKEYVLALTVQELAEKFMGLGLA